MSGTGSRLSLENAWLYSSGPAARAISLIGHSIAALRHVNAYTGGARSSIFATDASGGALNITSATAHTAGIGSACFLPASQINADSVACETEKAPMLLMDGSGYARLHEVTGIAGRLAPIVAYTSGNRSEGGLIYLDSVDLAATGSDMPALWFGNTVATVYLDHVSLTVPSQLLVVANRSIIAPELDRFVGQEAASNYTIQPAIADVYITHSRLVGNIIALRDSQINLHLGEGSSLVGSISTDGSNAVVNVRLTNTARWTMTDRAEVGRLYNEDPTMRNIVTNGHSLVRAIS